MRPIPLCSGEWLDLSDPDPDLMTIEVIARSLSNLCRYTGHTAGFYSVAQHSVHTGELVARNGHPALVLEALMHDAAEAFINDLAAPLKETRLLEDYRALEARLEGVIAQKYDLDWRPAAWEVIKQADRDSYATETRDLFPPMNPRHEWTFFGDAEPDAGRIIPKAPPVAEFEFLKFYEEVKRDRERATSRV